MSRPVPLAALGEKGLLHALTARWQIDRRRILAGVGDDCAVLRGEGKNFLLFKTDAVVEGVHFRPRKSRNGSGARRWRGR